MLILFPFSIRVKPDSLLCFLFSVSLGLLKRLADDLIPKELNIR